jgi:diphosphomevalonate decarboxylase
MARLLAATAEAHPNIALAKYWGKQPFGHNLPAVPSLSVTLHGMRTRTTVSFEEGLLADSLLLGGRERQGRELERVQSMLERVRSKARAAGAGELPRARVESENDFPTASGLASSASAFAALALASLAAAGLAHGASDVSDLARRTSVSAARSAYGGFVELRRGEPGDEALPAEPVAPASHLDLVVLVAVVTEGPKDVASSEGMAATSLTSPYFEAWKALAPAVAARVRDAIVTRDLEALGVAAEESALAMHASALAARPGLLYWQPATVAALGTVRALRHAGHLAYATIDAGPHVKVLTTPAHEASVDAALRSTPGVLRTIRTIPGDGARLVEAHS